MNRLLTLALLTLTLCLYSATAQAAKNSSSPDGGDHAVSSGEETEAVPAGSTSRYAITYMNSQTTANFRSATVVSVSNQSPISCSVTVEYFKGFLTTPVCTITATIATSVTHDFCSRSLPSGATACNSTCSPLLIFDEGRARVSSTADADGFCANIAVDARLYHLTGTTTDTGVAAIGSPQIVRIGQGNSGN